MDANMPSKSEMSSTADACDIIYDSGGTAEPAMEVKSLKLLVWNISALMCLYYSVQLFSSSAILFGESSHLLFSHFSCEVAFSTFQKSICPRMLEKSRLGKALKSTWMSISHTCIVTFQLFSSKIWRLKFSNFDDLVAELLKMFKNASSNTKPFGGKVTFNRWGSCEIQNYGHVFVGSYVYLCSCWQTQWCQICVCWKKFIFRPP